MKKDNNACSSIFKEYPSDILFGNILRLQEEYEHELGIDFDSMTQEEKIIAVKEYSIALTLEMAEMIERLPWKPWRNYSKDDLNITKEELLEIHFEWTDMFFFLMNIGLALGINDKYASDLYRSKLEENKNRIKRGYSRKDTKL